MAIMNINEKSLHPAGAGEGNRPQGGKRPHGRNHHRRGNRSANRDASRDTSRDTSRDASRDASREDRNTPREDRNPPREAERRSHPSTGRPQRAPIRPASQADLPDMDNLLIEDGMVPCSENVDDHRTPDGSPEAAEIERILENDVFARRDDTIPAVIPEDKVVIVGIRFRPGGKTYFFDPGKLTCKVGQSAIVETARGVEFGEVSMGNRMLDSSLIVPPLRPVLRLATEADIAHNRQNHEREEEAFRIGVRKIAEHNLDMKLVSVQYTFDNAKLLFYFTSAKRVDFRELVKDLAGVFHIRIELRQIGIRDEARMIGGLGACGRPLCCTTFLSDFGQVSMKMAKEQNLSLNSTKISGCCGRLMCCLRYEHETYAAEIRLTPSVGSHVNTPDGPGVVVETAPLRGEVKVSLRGQTDAPPKKYHRDTVEVQSRERRETPTADDEPDTDE